MLRLRFEKKGRAVWISHLDLMRLFQRAFKRAGLPLTHTQGYNPRPSVSIALPLSVGAQSSCELLDFELEGEGYSCQDILQRLNKSLIEGVRVTEVYPNGRKIKELAYLQCAVVLEYDRKIPDDGVKQLQELFSTPELTVPKKSKNGIVEQNIIPMIHTLEVQTLTENEICLRAQICCQNPSLNPMQLVAAVERYLPQLKPDHSSCARLEILDHKHEIFR